MRVLVCGGRDYDDLVGVSIVLDTMHVRKPFTALIGGGARGADAGAATWAWHVGVPIEQFPADWETHGKAAGPIRNQRMIDEGRPDLVVAFPGGKGTADMVRRARAAGIEVREIGGN